MIVDEQIAADATSLPPRLLPPPPPPRVDRPTPAPPAATDDFELHAYNGRIVGAELRDREATDR